MSLPVAMRPLLSVAAVLVIASSLGAETAFDVKKLQERIDLRLRDSSMADAVAALSKLADIEIAAPADADQGLTGNLKGVTLKSALNALGKMSGLTWYIEERVVVFRRPTRISEENLPETPLEDLTPEEGMTVMLGSLDDAQLYRLSRGFPLSYAELAPLQQEILRAMLSSPAVGLTESGAVIRPLPPAEQTSMSFYVMPYLLITKPDAKELMPLRLDSTPYIYVKKPTVE